MALHIVLYQPELPSNTGNIARTCAATDTALHLIHPLGFSMNDKTLKRAGVDYWEFVQIHEYDSLDDFYNKTKGEYYYVTKYGDKLHTSCDYRDTEKEIYFIFGCETNGLPKEIIEKNHDRAIRVPMTDKVQALNLSNTAALLIYEALRQQKYLHLT